MHVDKLQFQFARKKKRDKKSVSMAPDSKKLYSSNGSLVSASGGKTHLGGGDGNAISESDIERAIISAAAAAGGE